MTREQLLQQLDVKFAVRLDSRNEAVRIAQQNLNDVIGLKEDKRQRIFNYFDALDKKTEIDRIVGGGEPII